MSGINQDLDALLYINDESEVIRQSHYPYSGTYVALSSNISRWRYSYIAIEGASSADTGASRRIVLEMLIRIETPQCEGGESV